MAISAEQALDTLERDEIHAVITDYRLPGRNGAQLIREMRLRGRQIPAVVMSAYSDEETIAAARAAGAMEVLTKPVAIVQLLGLVAGLLGRDAQSCAFRSDGTRVILASARRRQPGPQFLRRLRAARRNFTGPRPTRRRPGLERPLLLIGSAPAAGEEQIHAAVRRSTRSGSPDPGATRSAMRAWAGRGRAVAGAAWAGTRCAAVPGHGGVESSELGRSLMVLLGAAPLIAYVAAGLGLLGARPLVRIWLPLLLTAAPLSFLAMGLGFDGDLWPGLLFNTAALMAGVLVLSRSLREAGEPVRVPIGRGQRLRSHLGSALAMATLLYLAGAVLARPFHRYWGSTAVELAQPLPGDWPFRDPAFEVNHAVTIDAPPEKVWPWLVQLGQDRGGFYSYAWLENLFGLRIQNAERIRPEHQQLRAGDLVRAAPPDWLGGRLGPALGWRVESVQPGRALVLRGWGAFVLLPLPDGRTRFVIRSKMADRRAPVWGSALSLATFELPHFIMQRKMMLTIRELAERPPGQGAGFARGDL